MTAKQRAGWVGLRFLRPQGKALSQEAVTVITGVKNGQWEEIAHLTDIVLNYIYIYKNTPRSFDIAIYAIVPQERK